MKFNSFFAAAIGSVVLSATTALACPATGCEACNPNKSGKPVAIKIVHPEDFPRDFKHASVELELTIDEKGVPHEIRAINVDKRIKDQLIEAVAQWRFTPTMVNGQPVSRRFILPLEVSGEA